MRIIRLLASTCVLCLAVASSAQQPATTPAPATSTSAVSQIAPPAHPATADQIREYMALTGASKTTHDLFNTSVTAMQATSAPWYPASFWTDLRSEFLKLDIVTLYAPYYQRYVSQADMQAAIDFYRSPAGKNLLAVQPLIVRDAKVIMQKKGEDIGIEVYNRHKDEIEAAKKQYEAQHDTIHLN
ncbi:MAG: DUF2059 domain-containing protein [Acidobacteriaceae bacterium]